MQNPTIQGLTPRLMPVFEKVLSPPEDQLQPETRQVVENLVRHLRG